MTVPENAPAPPPPPPPPPPQYGDAGQGYAGSGYAGQPMPAVPPYSQYAQS